MATATPLRTVSPSSRTKVSAPSSTAATPPIPARILLHYAVGIVPPLVLVFFFLAGHQAMDNHAPAVGTAREQWLWTAGLAAATLIGGCLLALTHRWQAILGVLGGVPLAFWLRMQGETYGGEGCGGQEYQLCNHSALIGFPVWSLVLGALALAGSFAVALQKTRRPAAAPAAVLGTGLALTLALAAASIFLVASAPGNVPIAEEANRRIEVVHEYHGIPGPATGLVLAAVGAAAWLRRRAR